MTSAKQAAAIVPAPEETAVAEQKLGVLAIEIRSIDNQAREFVLRSAIEIGKRLTEAKTLVAYGEWGKWLETNVPYSHSTANNFMKVAAEYQVDSQALENLSYTQAVALLSLPADEREAFAEENNVADMSSRELQAAIKEKQELEAALKAKEAEVAEQKIKFDEWAKQQTEALNAKYLEELNLRKINESQVQRLQEEMEAAKAAGDAKATAKLKTDLRRAEKTASDTQKRLSDLEANLAEKEKELQAAAAAEAAEKIQKREQELADQAKRREEETAKQVAAMEEQLRKNNNTAAISVKVHFESLLGTFQKLVEAVKTVENEEQRKGFSERISQLCDQMKAQL